MFDTDGHNLNGIEIVQNFLFYNSEDGSIKVQVLVDAETETIWATKVLKEFMVKGFALDDERLKKGGNIFGKEYFDELLERVQEIRASERLFYQKLTDIFAESVDYDPQSQICRDFYASVQNKLEYAVIGKTAAEIITSRADANHPTMGPKIHGYDILSGKSKMSREQAEKIDSKVYEEFRPIQDSRFRSDFDKLVEKTTKK